MGFRKSLVKGFSMEEKTELKEDGIFARMVKAPEFGIFMALVAIIAVITYVAPSFFTFNNFFVVSRQIAFTAIVALGVIFVIITSGIDLSIGSMMGFVGIVGGLFLATGMPPALAFILGLMAGALCGLINGIIVAYLNVTPFIVTLGMMSMAGGGIYILTNGNSVRAIPKSYIKFFSQSVIDIDFAFADFGRLKVSIVVAICLLLSLIVHIILKYSVFGRRIYALGGNEEATRLSGINVKTVKLVCYVLSSTLAGVSGLLYIARFRSAQPTTGLGAEMDAIAACVIGGTSLLGGSGSVLGVLIGASIMGVIKNGLVLMQVSSYWQKSVIGLIIVLAAIVDVLRNRKRG